MVAMVKGYRRRLFHESKSAKDSESGDTFKDRPELPQRRNSSSLRTSCSHQLRASSHACDMPVTQLRTWSSDTRIFGAMWRPRSSSRSFRNYELGTSGTSLAAGTLMPT